MLDPLIGQMNLRQSILVKHVSRSISGTYLLEPAEGTTTHVTLGVRVWKPPSSLIRSHMRLPGLQDFNTAFIRYLLPHYRLLTSVIRNLRFDVAAGVFDLPPETDTVLRDLSFQEFLVRCWMAKRLPGDARLHLLGYLLPEDVMSIISRNVQL